jgi:hypothetical protein
LRWGAALPGGRVANERQRVLVSRPDKPSGGTLAPAGGKPPPEEHKLAFFLLTGQAVNETAPFDKLRERVIPNYPVVE